MSGVIEFLEELGFLLCEFEVLPGFVSRTRQCNLYRPFNTGIPDIVGDVDAPHSALLEEFLDPVPAANKVPNHHQTITIPGNSMNTRRPSEVGSLIYWTQFVI